MNSKIPRNPEKIIVEILLSLFLFVFVCGLLAGKFFPDKLYNVIYPEDTYSIIASESEKTVTLKKGNYIVCGMYYGKPIRWKYVIDDNGPVMQTTEIIGFTKYDDNKSDWKSSYIRGYLNTGDPLHLNNSCIQYNGDIFLLSKSQLSKIPESERGRSPTPEAIANCHSKYLFLRKYCWYWTSSGVSTNSLSVASVNQKGGFYKTPACDSLTGICPSIRLTSERIQVYGGNGSRNSPYVLLSNNK